jgi:PAS domain S-box-containing protein
MDSREDSDVSDGSGFRIDLLRFSPGATILVNREGTIEAANTLAGRLLLTDPGMLTGLAMKSLVLERSQEAWSQLFTRCFGDPSDRPLGDALDLWLRRADSSDFPVTISVRPYPSESPTHVIAWLQDMTTYHQTQEALRASEERFRIAARHTADIIQEADYEADELEMYGDIDALTGYPPGGFPRTISGWLDHIHPEDKDRIRDELEVYTASGEKHWRFRYRLLTADGSTRYWLDSGTVTESSPNGTFLRGVGAGQDITERVVREQKLQEALVELAAVKERLSSENIYLQEEIRGNLDHEEIVGDSMEFRRTLTQIRQVAGLDVTVLLTGETGTGKEILARALHASSTRRHHPLIKVNCAALPSTLIESELFGHEKGAFSGATSRRNGRFELADEGTLFLDEIGEIPLELQAKLLHVLEDGRFERLGSSTTLETDVRIIAATNRDLRRDVDAGRFRQDLFYRLTVFPVDVPPLRDRRSDIRPLTLYFLGRHSVKHGKTVDRISEVTMAAFEAYDWPGNVRELENLVERGVILSTGRSLTIDASVLNQLATTDPTQLGGGAGRGEEQTQPSGSGTLEDIERTHIIATLESCGWKVKGRGNAAERLGLNEATLRSRMKRYGIQRPR